jgi:hypothetical protein
LTSQHILVAARVMLAISVLCAVGSLAAFAHYLGGLGYKTTGVKLAAVGLACGLVACAVAGAA